MDKLFEQFRLATGLETKLEENQIIGQVIDSDRIRSRQNPDTETLIYLYLACPKESKHCACSKYLVL